MYRNGGVLGEEYVGSIRGGTEAPPIWCTYLGKCVPTLPYVGWECDGKCPRGRMAAAVVGEVLCYFRCS